MNALRRTKIVATLGPATDDQQTLVAMIRAGVDGVRINCSHGTRNDFIRRAWQARDAAATAGRHVAIMFDLQGPKIRLHESSRRADLDEGDQVRIVGEPTPEHWSLLYSEATLVVLPVLWNEPLGLEGLGAMAYGKPVVAFDTAGIREWLTDGETGVCVPFGRRVAFRDAVNGLLDDRGRLQAMGRRAREVWEQKFRPEQHISALVAHYEKLHKEVCL
jgi:glycosyltransferase involved in cell wall biosynthesis